MIRLKGTLRVGCQNWACISGQKRWICMRLYPVEISLQPLLDLPLKVSNSTLLGLVNSQQVVSS